MYMKRHLLKSDYLSYILLACSEPQEVFKYMEYCKLLFYNHILKCYFQCAKDDVKSVKQHT